MNKIRKILSMLMISVCLLCVITGCDAVGEVVGEVVEEVRSDADLLDYNTAYGVGENEYVIVLNNEVTDLRAIDDGDGNVYVDVETANDYFNSRIYWDEETCAVLYATPEGMAEYRPDSTTYNVGSKQQKSKNPVVIEADGKYYISMDFVSENTKMDCAVYTEPNRVVIRTKWGEVQTVKVTSSTEIRFKGGPESEMFRMLKKDEILTVIDKFEGEDWALVVSEDGYYGWVLNKHISSAKTTKLEEPKFDEPEFKSISKNYKINMAWHPIYTELANAEISYVLAETPGINTISPRWFHFENTEGDLIALGSAEYVEVCHSEDIEVWAMFSNEFVNFDGEMTNEILRSRSKRQHVLDQLDYYIDAYGVDGINLDFEMIGQSGADHYIQFVRELSALCREKEIVFSVDNYVPMFWMHYNHVEEGIFADYVIMMGYDEHHTGSQKAGSVASMGFVRQGLDDLTSMVPKEKVINAIPLFTRVWGTNDTGYVESFNAGMTEAAGYLEAKDVTPWYDEATGQYYGEYVSENDGRLYQIWLEDEFSLRKRMEMINEYDIAGVASWCIGWESGPETWEIIASYMN